MRFLVDNALSPLIADGLCHAAHEAVHVRDLGLTSASDEQIIREAVEQKRVVLTADTDFGAILALHSGVAPSVIVLRGRPKRPEAQLELILSNIGGLEDALNHGCIAVFEETRIRVRLLPIGESGDLR